MDLTDRTQRRTILTKKTFNPVTGETVTITRPKPVRKRKMTVARGKGDSYTIGDVLLSRLRPLRFAMVTGLQRSGVNTSGLPFKTLTVLYYNTFTGKKTDLSGFINNPVFKLSPKDETAGDIQEARNRTAMLNVSDVVDTIITLFKTSRDKYNKAVSMGFDPEKNITDEDLTRAKAVFLVEKRLRRELRHDNFVRQSDVITVVKWAVIGFIIYYILKNI